MRLPHRAFLVAAVVIATAGCGSGDDRRWAEPVGPVVWVAAEGTDALTLLDGATGDVITTVAGIAAPHNVQGTPDGDGVWVTGTGGVVRVDAASLAALAAAPSGDHPAHVVAGADGTVWATATGDGAVYEHTPTLRRSTRHALGGGPHGIRLSPDGRFAAIANLRAGRLDLIDLAGAQGPRPARGSWLRSIRVGPSPVQVAVSADSSTVFVSVAGTHEVVRVDVESAAITGRVTVPSAPAQVWVTSTGLLLSADQGTEADPGSTLSLIDTESMEVVDTVPTGSGPHGIVVDEDETRAWVTNTFDDSVTVVDLEERAAVETVLVGGSPNGITLTDTVPAAESGAAVHLSLPAPFAPRPHNHGTHGHDDDGHGHDDGDSHAH